jgi:hypothetical protein
MTGSLRRFGTAQRCSGPAASSCLSSHTRAIRQSRATVSAETSRTFAVSSTLQLVVQQRGDPPIGLFVARVPCAQPPEDDRRLLAAASVQGHEFDSAVGARVLDIDAAEVEERLARHPGDSVRWSA